MNAVTEVMDELRKALALVDQLGDARDKAERELAELQRRTSEALAQAVEWQRERDEALARCETLRELADAAAYEQGLAQRRMMDAQRERDEARAEVERLHRMFPVHPSSLTDACTDAYIRGAEAMREACAVALMSDGLVLSRERAANVVRTIQIPEEP